MEKGHMLVDETKKNTFYVSQDLENGHSLSSSTQKSNATAADVTTQSDQILATSSALDRAKNSPTPNDIQLNRETPNALRLASISNASAPTPTTLLTEDTHDAQANCLDKAVDYLEALSPTERKNANLVFLKTHDPAKDGNVGHVVVRQGSEVIDPTSGKRYDSLDAYLNENKQYVKAGEISADDAKKIFDTPAGSWMRQAAIDQTNTNSLEKLQVAKDHQAGEGEFTYSKGTSTEGAPKVWVTGDVDGRPDNRITARPLEPGQSLKGDAVIVDTNGNGKIDSSDLVYKIPNGTKFTVECVDGEIQLDAGIRDRLTMIGAAAKNGFDHYGAMSMQNYQTIMGNKSIEVLALSDSSMSDPYQCVAPYQIAVPWVDPRMV
jgi:hypothetical protein